MKTVLKLLAVLSVAFCMTFSPVLMSIANAGGINYEGFSGYGKNASWGDDDGQTRGLMFNFSFGGPKDYKKNSSIQEVYKNNLTENQWVGIGIAAIGVIAFALYNDDDDDCIDELTETYALNGVASEDYCERPRPD